MLVPRDREGEKIGMEFFRVRGNTGPGSKIFFPLFLVWGMQHRAFRCGLVLQGESVKVGGMLRVSSDVC